MGPSWRNMRFILRGPGPRRIDLKDGGAIRDISLTLGNNTLQLFGSSKGFYYFLTSPEEFLQVLSVDHFGGKNYGTFKAGMSRENKLESQSSSVNREKFPKMGCSPCHLGRIYLVGNTSKMM